MSDLANLHGIKRVWDNAQRPMAVVTRWNNFPDYKQTLQAHSNSVTVTTLSLCELLLPKKLDIDQHLILGCTVLHDHGEPLTGGDEHIDAQTANKPILEWEAFFELIEDLPESTRRKFLRFFTLPYVRKSCATKLPAHAWHIVSELQLNHAVSAATFDLIERYDYLLSAREGYRLKVRNPEEGILEHCFKRQAPLLNKLREEVPEFGAVWSNQLHDELAELAEKDARGEYVNDNENGE